MSAPGSAVAGDVPGKFDVVINGYGYCFADTVDPSLPFRTHRAIYDLTEPFVERQNVGNNYGDNTQDFFMTATQNDWALGEQQQFFRSTDSTSIRRYWKGTNINPGLIDGRVILRPASGTISTGTLVTCAPCVDPTKVVGLSSTNLYTFATNSSTSVGAHGVGSTPSQFAICNDGDLMYIGSSSATKIRYWDGASTFGDFATSSADAKALCFVDNTLWAARGGGILTTYDTSGNATDQFQFKGADGGVSSRSIIKLLAYGGQVMALVVSSTGGAPAELWVGDTTGFAVVAQFNEGFVAKDMTQCEGIVFVAGNQAIFPAQSGGANIPTVNYYANGNIGRLWQSKNPNSTNGISVCPYDQGILIADDSSQTVLYYNIGTGGISTMYSYTKSGVVTVAAGSGQVLVTNSSSSAYGMYATTAASSGTVQSSLFDFDSTLQKVFRGVTVDWDYAAFGDATPASVDIAYQVDGVNGSYTSLQTGATSGAEYEFPTNTNGSAVSIQVTLNKGSSSYGPALKRIAVRAAPRLPQYRSGTYILDCTGSTDAPRILRDGSYHPLTGYEQVQNLQTAAEATAPFSVTDKLGTFTAFIDLNDPDGYDVYEVKPNLENPEDPGSYLVRLKARQV